MPFSTTNTIPKFNATCTVKFAGLMLLKAGEGNTCEVGVHRLSAFHAFQAMLVVNQPGKTLELSRLITGPLTAPLTIDLVPAPESGFQLFAQEPFGRENERSHRFDYRWAINMRKLNPKADFTDNARPGVTLNAGILYSSKLTSPDLEPELISAKPPTSGPQPPSSGPQQAGSAPKKLHKFAADLAVAIDVPDGSNLVIGWQESNQQKILNLPRETDEPGTTYTISLMNDPPTAGITVPHDELGLYYDVLEEGGAPIPLAKQFRFKTREEATDAIPCMPVTVGPP